MTPSEATNSATRREWQALGFFYDRDDAARTWRIVGSIAGLRAFVELLQAYCREPRNAGLGEHDHYGPYMYLKIMTWHDAGISGNAIHGSLDDLRRLAGLIEQRLREATPGDTLAVGKTYVPECEYDLVLEIRDAGFDPAGADPCLR